MVGFGPDDPKVETMLHNADEEIVIVDHPAITF